jgi:hypothetical protein
VEAVRAALTALGLESSTTLTAEAVDEIFRNAGRRRKGEFALDSELSSSGDLKRTSW